MLQRQVLPQLSVLCRAFDLSGTDFSSFLMESQKNVSHFASASAFPTVADTALFAASILAIYSQGLELYIAYTFNCI